MKSEGSNAVEILRSWLIAPANRPNFLRKWHSCVADCYVLDLEDGTPETEKEATRRALPEIVAELRRGGLSGTLYVRTNAPRSPHTPRDLDVVLATDINGISIPKLDSVEELKPYVRAIEAAEKARPGKRFSIIGGIESANGVLNVTAICAADPHLVAVYFGAEDFATDVGGVRRTRQGLEVLYARSRVVLGAHAARIAALDHAVLDFRDEEQFREDSEFGRNLGFDGKICIHPRQAELANLYFAPTPQEIDFSRRLVAAYEDAERHGIGTIAFEGLMVDGPLVKRARRVVAAANRIAGRH